MTENKEKKPMNPTVKLRLLQAGGFLTEITPLVVGVGVNWDTYVSTSASQYSLGFGGIFALVLIVLQAFELLPKKPKRVVVAAVLFGLAYCLQALFADIVFLLGMYLAGEAGELAIFDWQIARQKKAIDNGKTADAVSVAVTNAISKMNNDNSGRV